MSLDEMKTLREILNHNLDVGEEHTQPLASFEEVINIYSARLLSHQGDDLPEDQIKFLYDSLIGNFVDRIVKVKTKNNDFEL
jgi:hypothetical protein